MEICQAVPDQKCVQANLAKDPLELWWTSQPLTSIRSLRPLVPHAGIHVKKKFCPNFS